MAEDWLEPGMFMGEGVNDLCLTTWLMFLTVSKTRFWWLGRHGGHEQAHREERALTPPQTATSKEAR